MIGTPGAARQQNGRDRYLPRIIRRTLGSIYVNYRQNVVWMLLATGGRLWSSAGATRLSMDPNLNRRGVSK
jgi:hypothetical protein